MTPNPPGTDRSRIVAVFDFDKTLSTRDNVVPFLVAVAGRRSVVVALAGSVPKLLRRRRDAVKARLVRLLLTGRAETVVRAAAERLATDVIAAHLRRDVVARAAWHRRAGHELVIVSASFAWYLEPVARHLGFDAVLATDLEVIAGRLSGRLVGANVRGIEKVRRLDTWLAGVPAQVWAYGDSAGDRELLARADVAIRVGGAALGEEPEPDSTQGSGRVAR